MSTLIPANLSAESERPTDVLFVGDSMIRRLQICNQPLRIWKFCYPGGTAEDLHNHFPTEKLPGESMIGAVLISLGTNDLSRSRGRIRTLNEVVCFLQSFVKRLTKMYPQSKVVFCSILPRLDLDDQRVQRVNSKMDAFMRGFSTRTSYFDCSRAYRGNDHMVVREYFRDTAEDVVHLSDSGTQVQQDVFNQYFINLKKSILASRVDLSRLMWQSEWEYYNMWNIRNADVRSNSYCERKRITNFGPDMYQSVKDIEQQQSTNRVWKV